MSIFTNRKYKASQKLLMILPVLIVLALSILILSAWVANEYFSVNVTNGLYTIQDGIRIMIPGNQEKILKASSVDSASGSSSYELIYQTPDDVEEIITLPFLVDGYETELTFSLVNRDSKIIPIYKPGTGKYPEKPLTRIGSSNRFLLEYDVSIYIVDFDEKCISKFLDDETDGIKLESAKKSSEDNETYLYWATNPQVSPDGTVMLYYTNRYAPRSAIRLYNFLTEEDMLLSNSSSFSDKVIWNRKQSVISRDMYNLVEISLSDIRPKVILSDYVIYWDGLYPYVLFCNEKNQLVLLNNDTRDNNVLLNLQSNYTDCMITCNSDITAASALFMQNCTDSAELSLIRFSDKKTISLMSFNKPFLTQTLQWINTSKILVSGTIDGEEKTYELDLSEVLKQ